MNLPKDPVILLSYVNTMLRDRHVSLEDFCKTHNIPQETINVLEVKNNLFNQTTFNDYNKFISAEKSVMEQIAIDQGLLTQADEEAKNIIEAFLKTVPGIDQYKLVFK